MPEINLEKIAMDILGDKIANEDEKKKISARLLVLEEKLKDSIFGALHELRKQLDTDVLRDKFNSSDMDDIVRGIEGEIKDSRYAGD